MLLEIWGSLTNREKAAIVWLLLAAAVIFGNKYVRSSFLLLLKSFLHLQILIPFLLMFSYLSVVIYTARDFLIWDAETVKDILFWFSGSAFILFTNVPNFGNKNFFIKVLKENIGFLAIFVFLTNFYVLPLWAELFLLPFLVVLAIMVAIAGTKKEFSGANKLLSSIMSITGTLLLSYSVYNLILNFENFISIRTAQEFFLPTLLTIAAIPYLYLLALYSAYQTLFMRLNTLIKNKQLASKIKLKILLRFHFNLSALRKLSALRSSQLVNISGEKEIDSALEEAR